MIDSGAFSAWNSGAEITLDAYVDACKHALELPFPPDEIFALDVIGDWQAGLRNTEEMWRRGIEAIPCFHIGEPWEVLKGLARNYPKIALGGVAKSTPQTKLKFAEECFARVWPKRMHGFSYCFKSAVLGLPWDTVDSTSWFLQALRYRRFVGINGGAHCRGVKEPTSLVAEIDFYLQLEGLARLRWKGTWEKQKDGRGGPLLYLAYRGGKVTGFEKTLSADKKERVKQ